MPRSLSRIAAILLAMSLLLVPSMGRAQSGAQGWRDSLSKAIRAKTAEVSAKVKERGNRMVQKAAAKVEEKGNNFARKAAGRTKSPPARGGRPATRRPARSDRPAPRHRRPATAPARTPRGAHR